MKGRKPYEAAAQEALEEAGVTGQAKKKPIGTYTYSFAPRRSDRRSFWLRLNRGFAPQNLDPPREHPIVKHEEAANDLATDPNLDTRFGYWIDSELSKLVKQKRKGAGRGTRKRRSQDQPTLKGLSGSGDE